MNTDQLLSEVLSELREIKQTLKGSGAQTCNSGDALLILGVKDPRYLTHYVREGLLNRRGGGKGGFIYYKDELYKLASHIREQGIPSVKSIYKASA